MEGMSTAMADTAAAKPSVVQRMNRYFKDVRGEMRRVVWPTRSEVINSSVVVIVTLIFFVLFTFVIDQFASFLFIDLPTRF
jgi:preprotein translocase subunit SecE